MPCYYPLTGWRSRRRNPNGKRNITFRKSEGFADQEVTIPCGKCIGCRLEHSRQWAVRCVHEASLHENNCFITLTYSDEKIPTLLGEPTLRKDHFQKFMKRLRKKIRDEDDKINALLALQDKDPLPYRVIKFYAAGEYGEGVGERAGKNPHYHACIFGHDFGDKRLWSEKNGNKIYTSESLDALWSDPEDGKPYGFATVAEVTFETAAYTARYCMKKQKGKGSKEFYERVDPRTGEILSIQPEFALMSRRPGIGAAWLDVYGKEVLNNDSVVMNAREMKPPKYYDTKLEKMYSTKMALIKASRKAASDNPNNSLARLYVRGICKQEQIKNLKKEL